MKRTFPQFTQMLARGQLKNTSAVDDRNGGVLNPEHEEQILGFVNQGLIDMTTRTKLFEGVNSIIFLPNQNIYELSDEDFPDYVKVLKVHGINQSGQEKSHTPRGAHITQPSTSTLRFSTQFMKEFSPAVDVHYQMHHPVIAADGEIDLPANLHEPLFLYVAGLFLSHMGGEQHTAKGDAYYGLYLKMMSDDIIENKSGSSEVTDEDTRFQDKGFV